MKREEAYDYAMRACESTWNNKLCADIRKALEQKFGKWVKDEEQTNVEITYHCSECGCKAWGEVEKTNYCPDCGARMESEE